MNHPKHYCLFCYAPVLPEAKDCPVCGRPVRPHQQKRYWSLERKLVILQRLLISGSALFCGTLIVLMTFMLPHLGRGAGYLLTMPLILAAVLQKTFSRLTRRDGYFRPSLFWGLFFGIIGAISLWATVQFARLGSGSDGADYRLTVAALCTVLCGALSFFLLVKAPGLYQRWKQSKIDA